MIMVGRLGTDAIAAVGLVLPVYGVTTAILTGILFPTLILISQARGANRLRIVPGIIWQGIWISAFFSVLTYAVLINTENILLSTGQDPAIAQMTGVYMDYFLWGTFSGLTFSVFSFALVAMGRTGAIGVITWLQVILNVLLNYVLIFGKFGFPEMGVAGSALASVIVIGLGQMGLFVVLAFHKFFSSSTAFRHSWRPKWTTMGKFFQMGWPRSVQQGLKGGMHSVMAFLAGLFGVQALASHSIAYQVTTVVTAIATVPIARGVTAHIGGMMGRKDHAGMWSGLNSGLVLFLLLALPLAVTLKLFSPWISMLFLGFDLKAHALLPVAAPLIALAAFATLTNGLQTIVSNALNGLSDMKMPALIVVLAYWEIGIPAGVVFGFVMDLGVLGLWLGMLLGMSIAAIACLIRFQRMVRNLSLGSISKRY